MDPLSGVSPVMEILRRQMAENLEKMRKSGTASAGLAAGPRARAGSAAPDLRQTLARRIGAVDARDPQFHEKATVLFVESILSAEFGEGIGNDAGFRDMIREIARTLAAEPAIAGDLSQLFAELTGG